MIAMHTCHQDDAEIHWTSWFLRRICAKVDEPAQIVKDFCNLTKPVSNGSVRSLGLPSLKVTNRPWKQVFFHLDCLTIGHPKATNFDPPSLKTGANPRWLHLCGRQGWTVEPREKLKQQTMHQKFNKRYVDWTWTITCWNKKRDHYLDVWYYSWILPIFDWKWFLILELIYSSSRNFVTKWFILRLISLSYLTSLVLLMNTVVIGRRSLYSWEAWLSSLGPKGSYECWKRRCCSTQIVVESCYVIGSMGLVEFLFGKGFLKIN